MNDDYAEAHRAMTDHVLRSFGLPRRLADPEAPVSERDYGDAMLAEIIAHPGDDTPRLVYADWLDDHGDEARAEFIRVQVELAAMDERGDGYIDPEYGHTCHQWPCPACALVDRYEGLRRRERELWLAGRAHWAAGLPGVLGDATNELGWWWRRGFVARCEMTLAQWLRFGPAAVLAAPLEEVRLSDCPVVPRDAALPELPPFSVRQPAPWPLARIGWRPTRESAEAALSAACLAWAHGATGVVASAGG